MNTVNIGLPQAGDILVVDDTPINVELLVGMLEGAGFHVRAATNGESALHCVQAAQPALILLDIMMPGMDGFEVCRRLKEDALTRDIPVLFLSALTNTADKLKGFELGAVDYITKPFHVKEVLARVRVHLALSAAQEHLAHQVRELQQTDEQLARDIAAHKGIQENLEAALKRLQTLNVQITTGQEEERHKLAHELHEQLGQEIASLKMYLDLLKGQGLGQEAQARLLVAHGITKAMLERIRSMSRSLRPPELDALDSFGLFRALKMYCEQQAGAGGWVLHFAAPPAEAPPRDVALACFRVVQDALANIAQHADVTEVWLALRNDAGELRLSLRDNGAAFNAAGAHDRAQAQSLVLIGMQERTRQVGGSVEIKASPGGGNEIVAAFPRGLAADGQQG